MKTRQTIAIQRFPLFLTAAAALLAGMAAGLARMGWSLPAADLPLLHGPLMVCAFFGTLIGLERAVALARPWGYAAPLLGGLGALALITGLSETAGALLITGGSGIFAVMALAVVRRQPVLFTAVMALGALAWLAGNLLWLAGQPIELAVTWWAAFLVLTIAGERLELSRFLPPTRWRGPTVVPPLVLVLAAPLLGQIRAGLLWPTFGLGMLLLAAWMARHDIARRTVRQQKLTRFMAVCLLSGYVWLAAAGLTALVLPIAGGGPFYDAALHALFVGFVFAMVFGHAPVILPAVLRINVPYRALFYGPLLLLHASLLVRLAGDLANWPELRQWGGLGNAAAILAFLGLTAATAIAATNKARNSLPRAS